MPEMPKTRADCVNGPRPCPWTECRYHIPGDGPTCTLDVADDGEHTPAEVAKILGLTRQGVEWIIENVRRKVSAIGAEVYE